MAGQTNGSANGKPNPLSQMEQVVSASLRPLPTETGDGTYVKGEAMTGFAKDIGHFGPKDVETLAEVAKSAVTGAPVNDREYIMERVIQVCWKVDYLTATSAYSVPACCRLAFDLPQWQGTHQYVSQYPLE